MDVKAELRGIFTAVKKNLPGSEHRLLKLLHDREPEVRYEVAKAIGERAFVPFARRVVDRLAEEDDAMVRGALIGACGALATPETLAALLDLAAKDKKKRTSDRGRLLDALRKHAPEEARSYFQAVFAADVPEPAVAFDHRRDEQVLAAWGIMKLGHEDEAHTFLVSMLEDPPLDLLDAIGEVAATDPGRSRRAKQALDELGLSPRRSRVPPPPAPSSASRSGGAKRKSVFPPSR